MEVHKTLVRPVVLYCTKFEENKLLIFGRKILRWIFGPKRNDEGGYEIKPNRELTNLFNDPNIAVILKVQRIKRAGHVRKAEDQLILAIAKWKPNKSRPRRRPGQRWEDRVKGDLRMMELRTKKNWQSTEKHGRR